MSSPSYLYEAEAGAIDAESARTSYAAERAGPAKSFGLFSKLFAIGSWGALVTLIVSAATVPGFIVLALLPLAGMPYLVFCLIAWTGDREVE